VCGGRNWEGFFADPFGTGVAAYLTVQGMIDGGVMTTAKHWIGYEQDTFRYDCALLLCLTLR
jgi:beta-glucosidase